MAASLPQPNAAEVLSNGHAAREAISAALPAQRGWDWLPRLPSWLDPLSTLIALKTCIGLVIGVSIALWLGWSATGVGFACIMLQTAYLGRTLGRSILRMVGALAGAVLAMVFVATLVQERAALLAAYALITALIIYLEEVSEHPYALMFVLLSVGLITFATINDPENAFHVALSWVSGNGLGITIVLIMNGVLWPHTGEKSFEHQLETYLQGLSHLFTLKMASLPQEARQAGAADPEATRAEIRKLESHLIAALAPLQLTLGIASRDTDRFVRFEAAYADLIERLETLTSIIIAYGDSLRIWRSTSLADVVIPTSSAPHRVASVLQNQIDNLVSACDRARDGSNLPRKRQAEDVISAQIAEVRKGILASEHSALDDALFDAVTSKALQMSRTIDEVLHAIATVEQPGKRIPDAPLPQIDVITQVRSLGLRLQKAVIGSVAVLAASLFWIYLDWPAPGSFLVFVILPVALNAMIPTFPVKAALKSLFWGPVLGAVLYFVIMPNVTSMWQLAPILILCLLPTTYLTNSSNPATMIFGLTTTLWAFVLIDISNGQLYDFAVFSNQALGIIGGVGIGLAALALINPPVPERQFKTYARAFLEACEAGVRALDEETERKRSLITARRAERFELLNLCGMWGRQLDPNRHHDAERAALAAFMDSLHSLTFRLEALGDARDRYVGDELIAAPASNCSGLSIEALENLRRSISGTARHHASVNVLQTEDQFRIALEPERAGPSDSFEEALTLTGYYCALADAVDECQQRANAIDWRRWEISHF